MGIDQALKKNRPKYIDSTFSFESDAVLSFVKNISTSHLRSTCDIPAKFSIELMNRHAHVNKFHFVSTDKLTPILVMLLKSAYKWVNKISVYFTMNEKKNN